MKPGDTLENGWTVISSTNSHVLAMMPGKAYQPFATWAHDRGLTYWGNYHDDFQAAAQDLMERTGISEASKALMVVKRDLVCQEYGLRYGHSTHRYRHSDANAAGQAAGRSVSLRQGIGGSTQRRVA